MDIKMEKMKKEADNLNLVAIDGTNSRLAIAGGYDIYFITFRYENGGKCDSRVGGSFDKMAAKINKLQGFFQQNGLDNFVNVGNKMLINLDKVVDYIWEYNLLGYQYIWIEFRDGSQYQVYSGTDEKKAEKFICKFQNIQKEYKQNLKNGIANSK